MPAEHEWVSIAFSCWMLFTILSDHVGRHVGGIAKRGIASRLRIGAPSAAGASRAVSVIGTGAMARIGLKGLPDENFLDVVVAETACGSGWRMQGQTHNK